MQSDARSVSKTSKATGLHGEIRLDRFFHRGHAVMLQQPGSDELKRDEINILPPLPPRASKAATRYTVAVFPLHTSVQRCIQV